MTFFSQPTFPTNEVDDELRALAKLEATSNAIRLRVAGLSPDQLYRGSPDEPTIAELIANAVDREQAYLAAFGLSLQETNPRAAEPQTGAVYMDRDFGEDLGLFFDLRRRTLDILRTFSDRDWERGVTLPNGNIVKLEDLVVRLQHHDAQMLQAISKLKHQFKKSKGIDQLRDQGVAGKLGENLAQ